MKNFDCYRDSELGDLRDMFQKFILHFTKGYEEFLGHDNKFSS